MRASTRTTLLAATYVLVLVTAILMSVFDVLGLLPVLLIIGASGGILHLAYIVFFAKLPDYLAELKGGSEQPRDRS